MLLMQSHLEFQIVTPRTIADFHGDVLILPDARSLGKEELHHLESYAGSGKTLLVNGESGKYDSGGAEQASNPLHHMLGIQNPIERRAGKNFVYLPNCPGKAYYAQLRKEFDQAAVAGTFESAEFKPRRGNLWVTASVIEPLR